MVDLLHPNRTAHANDYFRGVRAIAPPKLVLIPAAIVVAAMIIPSGYLVLRAIGVGTEVIDILFRSRTMDILVRSLMLMLAVAGASVLIAIPVGWLTVNTDLPFRGLFSVITILPLVIPSYVGGFVLVVVLGPKGLLQEWLAPLGVERLPEVYGFPGAMLTLTLLSYPYVLLPVRAALYSLDPSLNETSRSLGMNPTYTFFRVILPMLRPAIAGGAMLVALYTLSDFGAVSLLHYETFTWAIYVQYGNFARDVAAALSLVLIALAIFLITIDTSTRGKAKYYRDATGVARQKLYRLGYWRWPAMLFCTTIVSLSLLAPISILIYWVVRGISHGEQLLILWDRLGNSLYVSGVAALMTVVAAMPLAILSARYQSRLSVLLERLSYIGFALPGIVVALAVVFFGVRYIPYFYQTLALLIFAYIVLFLPAALGSIRTSLVAVSPMLEEASRSLGRSRFTTFATITLPLIKPGIISGIIMVLMLSMKELPATLILGPIGFKTLSTTIWWATEDGFFAQAAVPALLLILASSIPMALLVWTGRKGVY
ncbi:iron ABC transporter permease [SAR202 cluster bacterium AC-647-N09_OGT_505m]|nr:iron ABC transporter permease [SAR202 cluster bacterium AC-647-N09_OGT_505m]